MSLRAFDFDTSWGFLLDIQREEKNVQKAIREAAKRNDMGSAKVLNTRLILVFFITKTLSLIRLQNTYRSITFHFQLELLQEQ